MKEKAKERGITFERSRQWCVFLSLSENIRTRETKQIQARPYSKNNYAPIKETGIITRKRFCQPRRLPFIRVLLHSTEEGKRSKHKSFKPTLIYFDTDTFV